MPRETPSACGPAGPTPLAKAASIPVEAHGRHPIFFFGTLMDEEVLARVLGRRVAGGALVPAELAGFRRVAAAGASYPVLVPALGEVVAGRLLRRFTPVDLLRINHFESEEYRAELHLVRTPGGEPEPAWLYVGLSVAHLQAAGRPWDLGRWQGRHKAAFLLACDRWLADCPRIDDEAMAR